MSSFFDLLDRLVALKAPSVVALQAVLGTPLIPVTPQTNVHWTFYQGASPTGPVRGVDFRTPHPSAAKRQPFLVLDLAPGRVRLDQLRQRYGAVTPRDVSPHHPTFVGYAFTDGRLCLGASVSTVDDAVLSVAVDYARPRSECRAS